MLEDFAFIIRGKCLMIILKTTMFIEVPLFRHKQS